MSIIFVVKRVSTNERVETPVIVQIIWIVVRWKKEILVHLLSRIATLWVGVVASLSLKMYDLFFKKWYRHSLQRVFSNNGSYILTWKKLSHGTQSLGGVWWVIQRHWKLTDHFYKLHQSDDILKFFLEKKSHISCFLSKQVFTYRSVESSIFVQIIQMKMRWKEEVLAHLLSSTTEVQVGYGLF